MKMLGPGSGLPKVIREVAEDDMDGYVQELQKRVQDLERLLSEEQGKLAWKEQEWKKLNQLYAELADTWNAFQALHRPTQRNVHRAEATGYLARKLIQLLYKDDAPMDLEQLKRLLE